MNRYKVSYKGKSYFYKGEDTFEVAAKFGNRKTFGNYSVLTVRLRMYDSATNGKEWAEYYADGRMALITRCPETSAI